MRWDKIVSMGLVIIAISAVLVTLPLVDAENNNVKSLKLQQPTELWNYTCGNNINDIVVSEDGNYIAVASQDGNLYFFKQDGTLLWTKNFGSDPPESVDITEYGTYIVVANGTMVHLYNNAGTDLGSFDTTESVYDVYITPDGKYAISIGYYIDFFNLSSGHMPTLYQWYADYGYSGQITVDGSYVLTDDGSKVYLFEGKDYAPLDPISNPNSPLWNFSDPANGNIEDACISQYGTYIVMGTDNHRLYVLNNNGSEKWMYTGDDSVNSVSMSYDENYVAAVIGDWLYVFQTSSSTPLWKDKQGPNMDFGWYDSISFARNTNLIIATGYSSNLYSNNADYYEWAKDVNNNTVWVSTYDYNYYYLRKDISGDGQYFAGTDNNYKVHFLGPPYVPEFPSMVPLVFIAAIFIMIPVLLRRR